jgi:hypothetical protein
MSSTMRAEREGATRMIEMLVKDATATWLLSVLPTDQVACFPHSVGRSRVTMTMEGALAAAVASSDLSRDILQTVAAALTALWA